MVTTPNRIREFRRRAGLTLEQLAERVDSSSQQIQRLETGDRRFTDTWMRRLAPALGVKPADLLGDDTDETGATLRDPDVGFLDDNSLSNEEHILARALYPKGKAATMMVGNSALILQGFVEGDRILVDLAEQVFRRGDIVVVQLHDDATGAAETLLRLYDPPYLRPASPSQNHKILSTDLDSVTIMGAVVARYRALR